MVILAPVPSTEETSSANVHPEPSMTTDSATVDSRDDKAAAGYSSDGFETASESEVNDEDTGGNSNKNSNDTVEHEQQQQPEQHQEQKSVAPKDHSYEDALDDDELKQKILAQMNEAKVEGNKLFGDSQYEEALLKYDFAIQLAPAMPSSAEIRSICHANRATCFFKLGKFEDTIKECREALELNPTYMKALIRRGEAHEKLEHYEEAIADMTKIIELDPSNHQARRNIVRLEPLAREKREKMKEEMIGKLKDMGNSILGKFGMSVDNFKTVKDPNTGSYSVSFQR